MTEQLIIEVEVWRTQIAFIFIKSKLQPKIPKVKLWRLKTGALGPVPALYVLFCCGLTVSSGGTCHFIGNVVRGVQRIPNVGFRFKVLRPGKRPPPPNNTRLKPSSDIVAFDLCGWSPN